MRRWNLYQRIAVLIALGVVLHVSCQAILFKDVGEAAGWFAYTPGSEHLEPAGPAKFTPIVQVLVFAGHVAVWTLAALWLLRDRADD